MASPKSSVPEVQESSWNHGEQKKGIVFTATSKTEVIITHENLFNVLKSEGSSRSLTSLLDSLADAYNTDFGNYSYGVSSGEIKEETKEWLIELAEFLKKE